MIFGSLLVTFRRLKRNKLTSFIKLVSLITGMISFMLISVYVFHEFSFDRFNKNADRIVRLVMEFSVNGSSTRWVVSGTKAGPQLQRTFPEVESFVRMSQASRVVSRQEIMFDEKNFLFVDSTFLKIFSFPLIEGNPATALEGPHKIVLTQSMAKRYFGDEDPLGKNLVISGEDNYTVSGVMKDVPGNSQVTFDCLASFSNLEVSRTEDWFPANYITYLLLEKGTDITNLGGKIDHYARAESHKDPNSSGIDYFTFHLEPLTYVHMHSGQEAMVPNIPATYIYILMLIALLIVFIACINYANLTLAQATEQRKEIGVRKILGALKYHLFGHFISESVFLSIVSVAIALMLAVAVLPYFNLLTSRDFTIGSLFHPAIAATLILLCIIISLLAGAYPAYLLSRHKLVDILKPGYNPGSSGGNMRRPLIIFQFVISIILIAITLVIQQQRVFIQHKNIGYNRDNIIYIHLDRQAWKHYYTLKPILKQYPGILDVTAANTTPTVITWTNTLSAATDNGEIQFSVRAAPVDMDYLKTLGIKIIAGSDFTDADYQYIKDEKRPDGNVGSLILNETAVRDIGWTPEDAIGRQVTVGVNGTVKAVIRDFNLASLHEKVKPLVIFPDDQFLNYMMIRIKGDNMPQTLAFIEKNWKEQMPLSPYAYNFLDDQYNSLYKAEEKTAGLFSTFSVIAVLLACLGLFGMTALMTVRRTKEIGIRKVLGATVSGITYLLSMEFVRLIILAFVLALPVAWYASHLWLESFAYRIKMPVWAFTVAGIFTLLIAMMTLGYQTIRAALTNPAESLRNE